MNPTGALVYDSQETAERKAGENRAEYSDLLHELSQLNISLDSLRLSRLIERGYETLRRL